MNILHTSLFASEDQNSVKSVIGAGFHNVGGSGVLRASNEAMIRQVELHYGERCGHLPLDTQELSVLVHFPTADIHAQMQYLSQLFGKKITARTFDEFKTTQTPQSALLVVPYINVPETETYVRDEIGAHVWGIPGRMTHVLKNKALFYQLVDELAVGGFCTPDYTIVHVQDVAQASAAFLREVEAIYAEAGLAQVYPLGVVLRAAESDGNYGCCLAYERAGEIVVIQNGDAEYANYYRDWHSALTYAQSYLIATMYPPKETRIVISRFLDLADSPGTSVVIMDGQVISLGWNGQYQKPGSTACIGTSTYTPRNAYMQRMRTLYEEPTATFFEAFLRKTAEKYAYDFTSLRGVANVDIMIPGEMERKLQEKRQQVGINYLAECNPRWTNYTDAIITVLGASRREPTIHNMRAVIEAGISTVDKYPLPINVDPAVLRERIFEKDQVLQQAGTRIICRMAKNPLGLIFAGDVKHAQQEMDDLLSNWPM